VISFIVGEGIKYTIVPLASVAQRYVFDDVKQTAALLVAAIRCVRYPLL